MLQKWRKDGGKVSIGCTWGNRKHVYKRLHFHKQAVVGKRANSRVMELDDIKKESGPVP